MKKKHQKMSENTEINNKKWKKNIKKLNPKKFQI